MDIENEKITIEKEGKEVECDILLTFDSEDTGKIYIVFSDNSKDEKGNLVLYAKSFDPVFNLVSDLIDQREIDMVNSAIQSAMSM